MWRAIIANNPKGCRSHSLVFVSLNYFSLFLANSYFSLPTFCVSSFFFPFFLLYFFLFFSVAHFLFSVSIYRPLFLFSLRSLFLSVLLHHMLPFPFFSFPLSTHLKDFSLPFISLSFAFSSFYPLSFPLSPFLFLR